MIFEGDSIEERNNVPQSRSGRSVEINIAQNLSGYPGRAATSKLASMATAIRRKTTMVSVHSVDKSNSSSAADKCSCYCAMIYL